MLLDHGYQLRKRMRPGWVPSWRDTQLHPNLFEDGYRHWVRTQRFLTRIRDFFKSIYQMRQVVDATRVEDGQIVAIKEVRRITKGREREIMHHPHSRPTSPGSQKIIVRHSLTTFRTSASLSTNSLSCPYTGNSTTPRSMPSER